MARINLYVRDEDKELFERAKEVLGEDKISPVVAEALRRLVEQEEAKAEGFEEIILKVGTYGGHLGQSDDLKKIQFVGKELATFTQLEGQFTSGDDRGKHWKIFLSQKGKFLIHLDDWSRWQGEYSQMTYQIFDSLDEIEYLEDIEIPEKLVLDAKEELGESGAIRLDI